MTKFISDMGVTYTLEDNQGRSVSLIPRYAVWDKVDGKNQVIECFATLEQAKKKFGQDLPVYNIKGTRGKG